MRAVRHATGWSISVAFMALTIAACGAGTASATPGSSQVPSLAPSLAASVTPSASPAGETLHIVAIGDSIPFAAFCPGCTGFVDLYARSLKQTTGRPVQVTNRSRDDSAGLLEIETQVTAEATLRDQLAAADVVIVSIGANNALPDAVTHATLATHYGRDWGCVGNMGDTIASYTAWLLATTPACRQTTRDSYAFLYDEIFKAIVDLRAGKPTQLAVVNTYNANFRSADFLGASLPQATQDKLWPLMTGIYDRWNEMECKSATGHGFVCVDLYHAFNGPKGDQAIGTLSVDGSHPSQKGNDVIAQMLVALGTASIAQ